MEETSIGNDHWDDRELEYLLENIGGRPDLLNNDFEDQIEPFDMESDDPHVTKREVIQPMTSQHKPIRPESEVKSETDSGVQDLPFKSSITTSSPYHCSSPNSSNYSPPPSQYSPSIHSAPITSTHAEEVHIQFSNNTSANQQVPVSAFEKDGKIFIIQNLQSDPNQNMEPETMSPEGSTNMSNHYGPKKKKVERNKAHNVIEKRYRHSINDRIETLKSLLGGRDSKLSKSAVLRLAIDEIERNRKKVAELEEENKLLRENQVQTSSIPGSSILRGILNPRNQVQCVSSNSGQAIEQIPIQKIEKNSDNDNGYTTSSFINAEKGYNGPIQVRSDGMRIMYSFMAFFALIIPVSKFLNLDAESYLHPDSSQAESHFGRTLNSLETDDFDSTTLKVVNWSLSIMSYTFVNCVIFFYLMYRVLVQMEPTTALHSSESKQYSVAYQNGVDTFERYELTKSKEQMTDCLDILGRFHAKSRLDGIVSVMWSMLLKVTNKSGIKWFVCCLASKLQSADHLQSAKMASMAYYMLAKIEFAIMTQYDSTKASRWSLFSYVSHSVLLLEGAVEKFTAEEACRIYLQAAIVYERFMPKWMSGFVVKRLTTKAINAAKKHSIQGDLIWLTDPIGEEFLNEFGFTEIEADFSAKTMTLCKIKLLSKSFRSFLIDKIAKKCANRYSDESTQLIGMVTLLQNCSKNDKNEIIDPVSYWWTACCFLIMHENGEHPASSTMKNELQIVLENVPKAMNPEFHECVNPAQQLGVVFYCFYKVCADELPFDCALGSLFVMNETLEKSFESSKFDQNRMQKRIGLNMAAFGADSILWATQQLYIKHKDNFTDERMVMLIESCEANLNLYNTILQSLPQSVNRYGMWEAFLKKLKNSNPTEIYDSIRKFKSQREAVHQTTGSDSDTDDGNVCRQTLLEGEKLMNDNLPNEFVDKNWVKRCIQSERGIT